MSSCRKKWLPTSVYVALLVFEKLNNTTQQNAFSIPNYEFFTTTSNDIYMLLWAAPRHVLKSTLLILAFHVSTSFLWKKHCSRSNLMNLRQQGSQTDRTTLKCLWNAAHWLETTARTEMRKLQTALVALFSNSLYNEVRLRRALAYNVCVYGVAGLEGKWMTKEWFDRPYSKLSHTTKRCLKTKLQFHTETRNGIYMLLWAAPRYYLSSTLFIAPFHVSTSFLWKKHCERTNLMNSESREAQRPNYTNVPMKCCALTRNYRANGDEKTADCTSGAILQLTI